MTDTLYGLMCNPFDAEAVANLYKLKGRKPDKPLPLLASSFSQLTSYVRYNIYELWLAQKFWPGALTMIMELRNGVHNKNWEKIGIQNNEAAFRVPASPEIINLIEEYCGLLVGTSANISDQANIKHFGELQLELNEHNRPIPLTYYYTKTKPSFEQSTIIKVGSNGEIKMIREGMISYSTLVNYIELKKNGDI